MNVLYDRESQATSGKYRSILATVMHPFSMIKAHIILIESLSIMFGHL